MKTVTVKLSEIAKDPTMRLDAKYWVDKKNSEKSVKTKKEITNQLKHLQEQKAKYIKEDNSKSNSKKNLL